MKQYVPYAFIGQNEEEVSPPVFIYPVQYILEYAQHANIAEYDNFLDKALQVFKKQFRYFVRTQRYFPTSGMSKCAFSEKVQFKWHCQGWDKCSKGEFLGSGLDDYPRMNGQDGEKSVMHLDLHCWMIELVKTIISLQKFFLNQ